MVTHRVALIALGVGSALLFTVWLGARDLWNPNEPIYGQAVVEMADRGDWSVPTVNGEVFGEKPILYFWLARMAAVLLGGINEFTLRLPSAAAGVALVLLLYLLVRSFAGVPRGAMAGCVLATTFIVYWSARWMQMDLLLAATTLATVFFATRVIDHDSGPLIGWGLAGVMAGLGFLAKGPVGLICPGLVLLVYLVATRRLHTVLTPPILAAAVSFLLVALPWPLLLWQRGQSGFLTELLYRQNLQRFVAPWDHEAPWWYFLKYFWIDMAPWSFFLPLALGLKPEDDREERLHKLAWSWIIVLIVFFSLSASKRSPYILPIAPAVAILVSGIANRWYRETLDRWRGHFVVLLHFTMAVGLLVFAWRLVGDPKWSGHAEAGIRLAAWTVVLAVLAGGLLLLLASSLASLGARRHRFGLPCVLLGFLVATYIVAAIRVLPAVNVLKSHRPMCEAIQARVGPDEPLRGFHEWRWRAGYSFYTRRPIPNLETLEELRDYWSRPERVFLVVERGRVDEARSVLGQIEPLEARAIGSNFAYLFSNEGSSLDIGP